MKQVNIINNIQELRRFKSEFAHLIKVVREADGKYVLHVHEDRANGAQKSLISKAEFDRVVSPAMYGSPSAFSKGVAGGRFLPKRLDAAYGALARAQARTDENTRGAGKALNRRDYIAYYYGNHFLTLGRRS